MLFDINKAFIKTRDMVCYFSVLRQVSVAVIVYASEQLTVDKDALVMCFGSTEAWQMRRRLTWKEDKNDDSDGYSAQILRIQWRSDTL